MAYELYPLRISGRQQDFGNDEFGYTQPISRRNWVLLGLALSRVSMGDGCGLLIARSYSTLYCFGLKAIGYTHFLLRVQGMSHLISCFYEHESCPPPDNSFTESLLNIMNRLMAHLRGGNPNIQVYLYAIAPPSDAEIITAFCTGVS